MLAAQSVPAGPVIVIETSKGVLSFETFVEEAPITVAHVVGLVRRGFYDGQRVHRVIPGFVAQFGDPQTRDLERRETWGFGTGAASGQPVGVAELSGKRQHRRGAVALAHMGDPAKGDSQMYVTLADRPDLNGRYVVFGQVTSGLEVLDLLRVGDDVLRVFVRE
jgi:cyclophilin family peptidyl-prolyl cis-trans isomerase